MCGVVCGAFQEDLNRYDRSARESMYARTNEGDWCKNHDCSLRHFRHRPFVAEKEEEEEKEEEAEA